MPDGFRVVYGDESILDCRVVCVGASVVGGDFALRQIHHITMWLFILFAIVHVYLVFYHDYVEGRGEVSSMTGGWKFIEEEAFEDAHQEARPLKRRREPTKNYP